MKISVNKESSSSEIINGILEKIKNKESLDVDEVSIFLNHVVYMVRKRICDCENRNIDDFDFRGTCNNAQAMLSYYFDDLGLKNTCVCTSKIFFNVVKHFFVIVYMPQNDELVPYLVDPTYSQFFTNLGDYLIKDGVVKKTPDPGYFVQVDDSFSSFLKSGFHMLDSEFAKIYGDSFYLTQIGITEEEYKKLFVSGTSYIKFFSKINNEPTKTRDYLFEKGLYPFDDSFLSKSKVR